jgi:HlyD family secretion protein
MEDEDIDSRSEAVRDYLEQVPSGLTRWGSAVISSILLIAILLTWLIRYPTIVRTDLKLTTQLAPKPVVARIDGRLEKLLVTNNQLVSPGQLLGFLESAARHEEVLQLETELKKVHRLFDKGDFNSFDTLKLTPLESLGDVQASYQNFRQQFAQLYSLLGKGYYNVKTELLKRDIAELEEMNQHQKSQYQLYKRDASLAESEFAMNQKLFADKVIAKLDLDREESKMLAKKLPLRNIETSILNNKAQIRSKQNQMIDLEKQVLEQKEGFRQSINSLNSSISAWKNRYLLISPSPGKILFANNLQEKENVKVGTELFQVFETTSVYVGTLTIPQDNSGKIKIGQRVLIKFQSYPFEEYGMVEGKVSSPPQLSSQDNKLFFAFVELPNGLKTNHNKTLAYNYGMAASAEIITEDLRLFERIFYTIRKVFNPS